MPTIEELEQGFRLGEWQVLPARREFRRGDEVVHPEPKQLKVLLSLALRNGEAVTRDQLVDECWDGRPTADEPINCANTWVMPGGRIDTSMYWSRRATT